MIDEKAILNRIEEHQKTYDASDRAKDLAKRMMRKYDNDQDYLKIEKEVVEYLQSDASETDKNYVRGYSESLYMMCTAIKEGRINTP